MKILVVSEYHILNTGYGTYYKNICEALHAAGHEVTELASYGNENKIEHVIAANKCPWDVYLNIPKVNTEQFSKYGSWNFENVVLEVMPDIVLAVRDPWYDKFILDSPLSKHFHTILSPTVDSRPLRGDWLYMFAQCSKVTTYNQWSEDWLRTQYGGNNVVSHIPLGIKPEYKPIEQKSARAKLGLPQDGKILLTVMRNQGRKRFPELFEAFAELDKTTYLYCHTHFHDRGWDLPKLGLQASILERVYFSYKCKHCYDVSADILKYDNKCKKCGGPKDVCSVEDGATDKDMNYVYNSADLYVQWASNEGFGVPIVEAAATGLKVITVNYSAQEDLSTKLESYPIDPIHLERDMGTSGLRGVPDNKALVKLLNNPESWNYNKQDVIDKVSANYSWEKTGKLWVELVGSLIPKNNWHQDDILTSPPSFNKIKDLPNEEFVKTCILSVVQDPKLLGSDIHAEVLDHLNNGFLIVEDKISGKKDAAQRSITRDMIYGRFFNMLENKVSLIRKKNKILHG